MAKLGLGTRLQQGMRQRQEMVLAPRMLQSIEVLALARADLDAWIASEAESNEALAVGSPNDVPAAPSRTTAAATRASDDHRALLEAQPDRGPSLHESVEQQLDARALSPELGEWVRFLVGCLDAGGLLAMSDDELRELAVDGDVTMAGTSRGDALLASAIAELQQLEPAGIGARSPVEALLLQLDPSDPDYAVLCRLLEDFLEELSRNKRPQVADRLGLELQELERLLGVLGTLNTRPGADLASDSSPVIHPDVVVHRDGEAFTVELSRGALPVVGVDPDSEELLGREGLDADAKRYLRAKVDKAREIVDAVELRGITLLRVAEATLRRQVGFLRDGPAGLVPLSMTELAEELELAVSTVSRTVAGKSAQTPWGIVPLRSFFQTSAGDEEGGGTATAAARETVRKLVEAEDPSAPLSDEALVKALADKGMTVARRTVAKYRKELDIPSSYRRKR